MSGRAWLAALAASSWLLASACAGGGTTRGETSDVVVAVPFVGGEHLEYVLVEAGEVLGSGELTASADAGGWSLEQRYEGRDGVTTDASQVFVDAQLRPRASERVIDRGSGDIETYVLRYEPAEERVLTSVDEAGELDERELRLREHAYDNESSLWLWRTLDLEEGYEQRYVSVNAFERTQQTVELRVTDRVELEVPAGTFDTWRLQIRNGRATRVAWIDVAPPHRVVQWDNGASVLQLASAVASE